MASDDLVGARIGNITVISYFPGQVSKVRFAGCGEEMIISIGTTTVKVFTRRSLFGWMVPKCWLSLPLEEVFPNWKHVSSVPRKCASVVTLGVLLDVAGECYSARHASLRFRMKETHHRACQALLAAS